MNCSCDASFTPVAGVSGWFRNMRNGHASPVVGVGQWNWGTFAQDIVKAGLQIGTTYAAGELGGDGQQSTGINPALVNPYQQQPGMIQQPQSAGMPDWILPIAIGGGVVLIFLALQLRR